MDVDLEKLFDTRSVVSIYSLNNTVEIIFKNEKKFSFSVVSVTFHLYDLLKVDNATSTSVNIENADFLKFSIIGQTVQLSINKHYYFPLEIESQLSEIRFIYKSYKIINKNLKPKPIEDIKLYESFFHDGSIEAIEESKEQIKFLLSSAEIEDDFMVDPEIILTSNNLIKGYLIIKSPFIMSLEGKYTVNLNITFKEIELLDLEITDHSVYLGFNVFNYDRKSYYTYISIESNNIKWQSFE